MWNLVKIVKFGQNFEIWPNLWNFWQNSEIWLKLPIWLWFGLVEIVKIGKNCEIWSKLWNLVEIVKFCWICGYFLQIVRFGWNSQFGYGLVWSGMVWSKLWSWIQNHESINEWIYKAVIELLGQLDTPIFHYHRFHRDDWLLPFGVGRRYCMGEQVQVCSRISEQTWILQCRRASKSFLSKTSWNKFSLSQSLIAWSSSLLFGLFCICTSFANCTY